jgi:phage gpG-like protein
MAGAAVSLDTRELDRFIERALNFGQNPEGVLRRVGQIVQSHTKQRFQDPSRRRRPWPKKWKMFSIWQGGKTEPLTARGRLMQSITYDLRGRGANASVRVGSGLPYAATHQWGDDRPRRFTLFIVPEYEDGVRGQRIKRDPDTGYPVGKMTIGQGDGAGGRVAPKGAVKVLVRLNSIRPRPFLQEPDQREAEEIHSLVTKYFLRTTGLQSGGAR